MLVEAAKTAKARCHRDIGDRQCTVMQQLFGQQQALGLPQCRWRHTELGLEQATQLARAQLHGLGEGGHATALHDAVGHQRKGSSQA